MNQIFRNKNDQLAQKGDNPDADDVELSSAEIDGLIQYFGINSSDTSESLVQGIKTLVTLVRS
jgi:hypothetical protein